MRSIHSSFTEGADVVRDQAADRVRGARPPRAVPPAPGRSAPIEVPSQSTCSTPSGRSQRHHVGHMAGGAQPCGFGRPVRPPSPHHVRADHAVAVLQRSRQRRSPALARQAVHTRSARARRASRPTPVGHPVQTRRADAGTNFSCGSVIASILPGSSCRGVDHGFGRQDRTRDRLHQRHRARHRTGASARQGARLILNGFGDTEGPLAQVKAAGSPQVGSTART